MKTETMTHYVWTYFEGTIEDAQEIVNEWNDITQTKKFRVTGNEYDDGTHLIEGEIEKWVLDETAIEMDFMIEER